MPWGRRNAITRYARVKRNVLCINCYALGAKELAGTPALRTPLRERLGGWRKLLDAVLPAIHHVQVALCVHRDPHRMVGLRRAPYAAPSREGLPCRREFLDGIRSVGHV